MLNRKMVLGLGGVSVAVLVASRIYKNKKTESEIKEQYQKIGKYLNHQSSIDRRTMIDKDVEYRLMICLEKGNKYKGIIEITVYLVQQNHLYIDFESEKGQIMELVTNGTKQYKVNWNRHFIIVNKEALKVGRNKICIQFENEYTNDGRGIHSFIDSDNSQYIYTFFAPAFCRKWIPCIDQPDVKGYLKMYAFIPNDWIAISNEDVVEQPLELDQIVGSLDSLFQWDIKVSRLVDGLAQEQYKLWHFTKTSKMSTYLFNICVGPYKQITNESGNTVIPMSLYCRSTLYDSLQKYSALIFETVEKSMTFYEHFFRCKFPFSKYDMIMCPQFEMGAMENVGAVTINDKYIYEGEVKKNQIARLVVILVHELCHMWFGNLVTMKWWNDIWLNESFADFFSYYAADKLQLSFDKFDFELLFNQNKDWGYSTDMSGVNLCISREIVDTEQAATIFDGITYSKGAAVLKQLSFIIGYEQFSKAMQEYFKKYRYANVTLDDFINTMDQYFDNEQFNLQDWKQEWIETYGCNNIEPIWNHENNSVMIKQTNGSRNHKLRVALFNRNGQVDIQDVFVKNQEYTEVMVEQIGQYQAVLLNYDDFAYCKVILDYKSQEFFSNSFKSVDKPVNQRIILRSLFEMVKDSKLSAQKYYEFVSQNVQSDLPDDIVDCMLQNMLVCLTSFIPQKYQDNIYVEIHRLIKQMVVEIDLNKQKDKQIMLMNYLIQYSHNQTQINELLSLHNNELQINNVDFGLYNRWMIIMKVVSKLSIDNDIKLQLINKQSQQDASQYSLNQTNIAQLAIRQDKATIEQWWHSFVNCLGPSKQQINDLMVAFVMQYEYNQQYYDQFFGSLIEVYTKQTVSYAQDFFNLLFPPTDDFDYLINHLNSLLAKIDGLNINALKKQLVARLNHVKQRKQAHQCFMEQI